MFYFEKRERLMGHMRTKPRGERTPPKKKTPTFVLELPLAVEAGQIQHVHRPSLRRQRGDAR